MIFRPELAAKVLAGDKTVTRRPLSDNPRSPWYRGRCALEPGRCYSVQPGRGKLGIGWIEIVQVRAEPLSAMCGGPGLATNEAALEGFASFAAFREAWKQINGSWDPSLLVWRVQFKRVRAETAVLKLVDVITDGGRQDRYHYH